MITRPTLNEILNKIINDIETEYSVTIPDVKGNLIRVLSKAIAGELYDNYGTVLFLSKQFFPLWS